MTSPSAREPIRHQGNQGLFRALELSLLATSIGLPLHIHAEGLRGTGKTTIIRSLRSRLPRIERIRGCIYNCLPGAPHCPAHRNLSPDEVFALGSELIAMPFREISHSAKIGTVAGSIDLARLADPSRPEAALLPGTVPQAHRGIIFVDEINRLADTAPELADLLLDVMGTKPGRLQVEETGLPGIDLPAAVSVWAASNPDEDPGPLEDIRKQLSDRFDFVISMERPSTVSTVREILRASRERLFPQPHATDAVSNRTTVRSDILGADDWARPGSAVGEAILPAGVEELIASLYIDFGLESLRGIEAIHLGARLNCVLEGRNRIGLADVLAVAPGALQHRLDVSTFARVMDYLTERAEAESAEAAPLETPDFGATSGSDQVEQGETSAQRTSPGSGDTGSEPDEAQREPAAAAEAGRAGAPGDRGGDTGRGTGWSLWRSLFGAQRDRDQESSTELPPDLRCDSSADGPLDARGASRGWGQTGPGTSAEGGVPPAPAPPEDPVSPPLQARPLAEILREMETAGGIPPWPRSR